MEKMGEFGEIRRTGIAGSLIRGSKESNCEAEPTTTWDHNPGHHNGGCGARTPREKGKQKKKGSRRRWVRCTRERRFLEKKRYMPLRGKGSEKKRAGGEKQFQAGGNVGVRAQ